LYRDFPGARHHYDDGDHHVDEADRAPCEPQNAARGYPLSPRELELAVERQRERSVRVALAAHHEVAPDRSRARHLVTDASPAGLPV
jgi:hypothetical protein